MPQPIGVKEESAGERLADFFRTKNSLRALRSDYGKFTDSAVCEIALDRYKTLTAALASRSLLAVRKITTDKLYHVSISAQSSNFAIASRSAAPFSLEIPVTLTATLFAATKVKAQA